MKIYFSGSIRGGREDQKTYFEIVNILREYGSVLTEHIGGEGLGKEGEPLPEKIIYERDMGWLRESDVVVAEVTRPSLGVGYEIGQAEELRKPILCLYRPGDVPKISAMVAGNPSVTTRPYGNMADVREILLDFLKHAST